MGTEVLVGTGVWVCVLGLLLVVQPEGSRESPARKAAAPPTSNSRLRRFIFLPPCGAI